ncbi:unnamed protein product [Commensalibacter communis]|uniref:hypothetical protein n=1 Tax=Commensalibacter communis TaxID=2972786 RepID=UPI0022FFBF3F|nr:hypothetical protein [Commensalibacter communis]CAI3954099.1 unnamed protein product [Commensalibacter communis]CAI3958754.1 unnamed protein product [Commensalibacter communis]
MTTPFGTTVAQNSFQTDSTGFIQGMMAVDPAARNNLVAGRIKPDDNNVYYGGLPIIENVAELKPSGTPVIQLATAVADIIGFTVFNQTNNLFLFGANTVPVTHNGGTINFLRFGSNARIALPCDPALRKYLNTPVSQAYVSWDFTKNQLIAGSESSNIPVRLLDMNFQSNVVAVDSATQNVTWNTQGTCALVLL